MGDLRLCSAGHEYSLLLRNSSCVTYCGKHCACSQWCPCFRHGVSYVKLSGRDCFNKETAYSVCCWYLIHRLHHRHRHRHRHRNRPHVHIHNDAPVFNQGCHMSNWTEGTDLTRKPHIVPVAGIYSLLLAHGKIRINLVLALGYELWTVEAEFSAMQVLPNCLHVWWHTWSCTHRTREFMAISR